MNNSNKKFIKLLFIVFIAFQSCRVEIENTNESTNNSTKEIEALYSDYFAKTTNWKEQLSQGKKENRQQLISKIKENPIYIRLVDSAEVSASYLPIISAIANGLTNTTSKGFAIDDVLLSRLESQQLGKAKSTFVVTSLALSLQNNGGFPKELLEVFERYKNKYSFYRNKGISFDANKKQEKIEYDYDCSAIFGVIAPNDLKGIEAIYEAREKNISRWNNGEGYVYPQIATINGFLQHLKTNHPSSKCLPSNHSADFWENYDPLVNERILTLVLLKDCQELQKEFDLADKNSPLQKKRIGKSNSELMGFIDNSMRRIDCY